LSTPSPLDHLLRKAPQRTYRGSNRLQIALPLGGIGAGSICLNGEGALQDFSIRHRPDTTAIPDETGDRVNYDSAFALLHIKNTGITRMVEGPLPPEKIYDQGLKAQGYRAGGQEGLPRFRQCSFRGEYPFGYVNLSDEAIPLAVQITGFNPFIPLDDVNSSIPCAILEYTLTNRSKETVDYEFSYHISHLAPGKDELSASASRNALIPGMGIYFYNIDRPQSASYGSAALGVIGHTPKIKAMWLRGGWYDSISALWREVSTGDFHENDGSEAERYGRVDGHYRDDVKKRNGGSILLAGSLKPGAKITYPIVITWHFPNVDFDFRGVKAIQLDLNEHTCCCNNNCEEQTQPAPKWHPYYVSQWKDARHVFQYVSKNYTGLRRRTRKFHDALFASSLPAYVLDAVSANLGILKSPTVLRQENGNIWAWEGCYCDRGCCKGSCTHVWNYAQAMPHLFPALERTLREQELERSMDDQGHINFRASLPDGPTDHSFHAAADGQLGGIMKVYREWQIYGDPVWLAKMYPLTKCSMDFCIEQWDPKHEGTLSEPHHNTYDIEFWGPDGMCTSFYCGALTAMAALARASGHSQDAPLYEELAKRSADYLDQQLFNGEYFYQKVAWKGMRDTSFADRINENKENPTEEESLLIAEGPKYQYGTGCISDGVFGAWLAELCQLESPQNRTHIRQMLESIFRYNFKTSLWDHANPQRPGYALGDEPGLLLCTWPHGGKPTLPFVYSDEVWTGIEYQVASHMIAAGMVEEGLTIVAALRSRYDGRTRNPWNEYECGSYYARALASYALLPALSGFRYSAVTQTLWLEPRLDMDSFRCFFSTASGWGTINLHDSATPNEAPVLDIDLVEGTLPVKEMIVTWKGKTWHPVV
jgi:uncharacterized protein (DUF608 family)